MSSPDYTSDLPSEALHDNSNNPRVCPYRNTRFYDQECSRYFDCPTHQIERARSEASVSEDVDEEVEDEEDEGNDEDEEHEDYSSNEASSVSEGGAEVLEVDEEAPEALENSHHNVVDLTTPSPEAGHASAHRLVSGAAVPRDAIENGSPELRQEREVIDLTSESPEPVVRAGPSTSNPHLERALPNLPNSASGSISSSQLSGGSASNSGQRRPGTPPSPPPPIRRRTSTNNFEPARGGYQQQRSMESGGPSDVALPRWQPDAEVTICPICHTQFSIFVRKHHCRYASPGLQPQLTLTSRPLTFLVCLENVAG